MSLSPEFDLGKRSTITSKVRCFHPCRNIYTRDQILLSHAFDMGTVSGVKITEEEADLYKTKRKEEPNGAPLKSDIVLMAEDILTAEKSAEFKKAYPHRFPPSQN